jgi:hypothetical protein
VSYPQHQGGRASEQWPSTVRHASYGLLLPAVPPAVAPATQVQVQAVEPAESYEPVDSRHVTDVHGDGEVSVPGRWSLLYWFRVRIIRRH